jgi:hypothetical protein
MAIEKHLVANVGETGKLYFVSGADKFDGIYVNGDEQNPVSFMSFIAGNDDVEPIKENEYQKFLWSMDIDNPKWQAEFIVMVPRKENTNPYNKKVHASLHALEQTERPRLFKKYINR